MTRLLYFLAIVCALTARGQHDPVPAATAPVVFRQGIHYMFIMKSGARFSGVVVEETEEFIRVSDRDTREEWELRKSEIERFSRITDARRYNELKYGINHHRRDYLLSSSAFPFSPSGFTSNAHWFLVDRMDYAFNENYALTINTFAFYPMTLGLKCAFQLDDLNYIGATVTGIANISAYSYGGSVFLGYAALARFTHGTDNRNLTFSAGVLSLRADLLTRFPAVPYFNMPFTSIAYCNRFAPRWAMNLEGWYLPGAESGMAGIGLKFLEDESTCWNFGCFALMNRQNNTLQLNFRALPIPYVGLTRRFS